VKWFLGRSKTPVICGGMGGAGRIALAAESVIRVDLAS